MTIHSWIIFRGVVPFIPPKLRHLVLAKAHGIDTGKNSTEASVTMIAWWPGITLDVQHFVAKCKNCQLNRPRLGKTTSLWPEPDVWERLHVDWGYVKEQGNILLIVDTGSGWNRRFPRNGKIEHQKQLKYIFVKSLHDSEVQKLKCLIMVLNL